MTNHTHPSLQTQFMAALLAFTMLAYANVWFIKLETRGISQEAPVETSAPDFSGMSREKMGEYIVAEVERQLSNPVNYLAAAAKSYTTTATPTPPGGLIWFQTSDPSTAPDKAYGVAVDSTGVYVVGLEAEPGTPGFQWRIEKRNLATGIPVWTQTSNPSALWDVATGVAVDSTGVYVVGYDNSLGQFAQWRIEKRSLTGTAL